MGIQLQMKLQFSYGHKTAESVDKMARRSALWYNFSQEVQAFLTVAT